MAKSVGNIRLLHEVLDRVRPRRAGHVLRRRPLPPAAAPSPTSALEEAARGVERIARGRAAARRRRRRPPDLAPLRERFFDALAEDFNTPRALAARVRAGSRGQQARRAVGDADLREMLGVLGLENLLERRGGGRRRTRGAGAARARASARARTSDFDERRPPARRARRARLGGPRRRRAAPSWSARA